MTEAPGSGSGTGDLDGGTGLCAEAQADGVPCTELGRDCDQCERAVRRRKDPGTDGPTPH
jgi:hypothetical protein